MFGKASVPVWLKHLWSEELGKKDGAVKWDQIKESTEEQGRKLELHAGVQAESLQLLGGEHAQPEVMWSG